MVLLEETDDILREVRVLLVRLSYLEGVEQSVEDHSNLQEEVVLDRSDVDDVLLH